MRANRSHPAHRRTSSPGIYYNIDAERRQHSMPPAHAGVTARVSHAAPCLAADFLRACGLTPSPAAHVRAVRATTRRLVCT